MTDTIHNLTQSNLTKTQVSILAESIANQFGFEPGGDISAFTRKIGGKIDVRDFFSLAGGADESIYIEAIGKFTIYVPAHTSAQRDRFTVAHELGHYFVHCLYPIQVRKSEIPLPARAFRYGSERIEWEANWFAASFLMPQAAFREQWRAAKGDLAEVASAFLVSEDAARVRASSFGLT